MTEYTIRNERTNSILQNLKPARSKLGAKNIEDKKGGDNRTVTQRVFHLGRKEFKWILSKLVKPTDFVDTE